MKIEFSLLICNIKGIFNMPSYDDMSIIFNSIRDGDEDQLLKDIGKFPLYMIDVYSKGIINMLLDTENVNMLHILIIYGMDCNEFINVIEAECYSAYILYKNNNEYENYYENPVFCVLNNYLNSYYTSLEEWSVNPIYYSIIHDCDHILLDFIKSGIISLETYFKQSCVSGIKQFFKYNPRSDHLIINTTDDSENYLFCDLPVLYYKSYAKYFNEKDFNAKELEHFEIFDKRIANVNMFINDKLSMHYNYIYKKKLDISVVYPIKYNYILKTIIMILNRYNYSHHKYYLPEELWICIIIPMFVTNY